MLITEFLETGDLKNYLKKDEAKTKLTFDKLVRISENVSTSILISFFTDLKFRIIL